jgi:hypothetical protein
MTQKNNINIFKKKPKKSKKMYCSPKNKKNKYSCFSKESLIKIIKQWNITNPKNKIKLNKSDSIPKLWIKIDNKLNDKCYGEWCWIQQEFVKNINDKEIKDTFRPKTPKSWYKNKNEWLSTVDIENAVKQYEKTHRDFKFIGAVPIDFDYEYSMGKCIIDELCKINLHENINSNKNKIGIVFNLDKHDESGSHWIAMYIDLYKNEIYFFDSYGEEPPKEVNTLANRLVEQGKKIGRNMKYKINETRHQYKNSECGVYCINFIISLLEGNSFEEITQNKVKDDVINLKRDYFFTPTL